MINKTIFLRFHIFMTSDVTSQLSLYNSVSTLGAREGKWRNLRRPCHLGGVTKERREIFYSDYLRFWTATLLVWVQRETERENYIIEWWCMEVTYAPRRKAKQHWFQGITRAHTHVETVALAPMHARSASLLLTFRWDIPVAFSKQWIIYTIYIYIYIYIYILYIYIYCICIYKIT